MLLAYLRAAYGLSGPKSVDSSAATVYWLKYLKAKQCLSQVAKAMCVTLSTAAALAGLQMPQPPVACAPPAEAGAAPDISQPPEARMPIYIFRRRNPGGARQQTFTGCCQQQAKCETTRSSRRGHCRWQGCCWVPPQAVGQQQQWPASRQQQQWHQNSFREQVCLPCAAAGLVAVLSSSWEGEDVPLVAAHLFPAEAIDAAGPPRAVGLSWWGQLASGQPGIARRATGFLLATTSAAAAPSAATTAAAAAG